MKEILQQDSFKPVTIGKMVEGTVIGHKHGALFLDLSPLGTGIVYGKEFYQNKERLEKLKKGDKVLAKIVDLDNEEGYIELSVSDVARELDFENLRKSKEFGEIFTVKINGANKGGLLTEISGIPAFLPVSQLLPKHYPKIEDGDKAKILRELQKFVGESLKVKILSLSLSKKQIILAETEEKEKQNLEELVGKEFNGEVVGVLSFGTMVKFDGLEGLIQKENLDLKENLKFGDKVRILVKEIKNEKILLSFLKKAE